LQVQARTKKRGDELPNVEPWQVYPFVPPHVASGDTFFETVVELGPAEVLAFVVLDD
jgi:hypothetical protein